MKRNTLLQHLRKHGCTLKREGAAHSLWTNPATGAVEAVPVTPRSQTFLRGRSAAALASQRSFEPIPSASSPSAFLMSHDVSSIEPGSCPVDPVDARELRDRLALASEMLAVRFVLYLSL